jgi:hypothetical protein
MIIKKKVLIFTFPNFKKNHYLPLLKLATVEIANMCSKKDVLLLPFSYVLGAKWGLRCACAQAKRRSDGACLLTKVK